MLEGARCGWTVELRRAVVADRHPGRRPFLADDPRRVFWDIGLVPFCCGVPSVQWPSALPPELSLGLASPEGQFAGAHAHPCVGQNGAAPGNLCAL